MTVIDWGASRAHQSPNTPKPPLALASISSEMALLPPFRSSRESGRPHKTPTWMEAERPASTNPPTMSRTTAHVLNMLMQGDMSRLRSDLVADALGVSPTTLRRRLRTDGTSYQLLLDQARRHRCEEKLTLRWLPGKSIAWELGYAEVNSFYRAFRRWTGESYSSYKLRYI